MSRPERFCTCHGISGSCSVQTCYDKVPSVEEVGETLYSKYEGAVKVDLVDDELKRMGNLQADPLKKTDLAYLDDSPDFCLNATAEGVQGTAHRDCDPAPNKPNSCSVLCCGRGYYRHTKTVTEKKCEFVYCCYLQCESHDTQVTVHRCNP